MGTYTELGRIAESTWMARRRRRVHRPAESVQSTAPEMQRHQCPRCEVSYPFSDSCPTCGVQTIDRSRVLVLRKRVESTGRRTGRSTLLWVFVLFTILGGASQVLLGRAEELEAVAPGGTVQLFLVGVLLILLLLAWLRAPLGRFLRRRAVRRRIRRERAMDRAIPPTAIGSLPGETDEPVRVRGRVELHADGDRVSVVVVDETGAVGLPPVEHLDAYDPHQLAPVELLEHGSLVEVVGTGARHPKAADAYREVSAPFDFAARMLPTRLAVLTGP